MPSFLAQSLMTIQAVSCLLLFSFPPPSLAAAAGGEKLDPDLASHITPEPNWLQVQTFDTQHQLAETQSVQYLLLDNQINIEQESPVYYSRVVSKVLNLEGVKDSSELSLRYNPAFQAIKFHRFHIIRDGEVSDLAKRGTIKLLQREESLSNSIQTGVLTALITFKDIRVGDVLDYSYSIVGTNPIFGKKRFGSTGLSWGVTIDKRHLAIYSANPNLPYKVHRSQVQLSKVKEGKTYRYHLTQHHLPAVTAEGHYPPGVSPFAWLEFSEYKSWQEVEAWARSLYDFEHYDTAPLQPIVKKLQKAKPSTEAYIEEAMRFVQDDIRYLGLEFGVNAFLPRPPKEVLAQRFGDCKDKSVLLTTLLAAKGVKSYPALVSSQNRHTIADSLPSPGVFDHVISLVEFNGKQYWIDGTKNYQRGGLAHYGRSDYGHALVVGRQGPAFVPMYPKAQPRSSVAIKELIGPGQDGTTADYRIVTHYRGAIAEYHRFRAASLPLTKLQDNILKYYGQYYEGIRSTKPIDISDNEHKNEITYTEHYEIPDYWRLDGSKYSTDVVLSALAEHIQMPKDSSRDLPYFLGGLIDVELKTRVQFPEEVIANIETTNERIDHAAFSIERTQAFDGETFDFAIRYRRLARQVAVEDFADYKAKLEVPSKDWHFTLTTHRAKAFPGVGDVLKLKRALKDLAGK